MWCRAGPRAGLPTCHLSASPWDARPKTRPSAATSTGASPSRPLSTSGDRSRGIRRCAPGSSRAPRVRHHRQDRQTPAANAARTRTPHSSSRPESSSETLSAIAPSPSSAPSRSAQIASARHPYTTYWPTWDSGMSLCARQGRNEYHQHIINRTFYH